MFKTEAFYKNCDECGHVFEIVTTESQLLADGFTPADWDEDGYIFKIQHGECDSTLIVAKDELY